MRNDESVFADVAELLDGYTLVPAARPGWLEIQQRSRVHTRRLLFVAVAATVVIVGGASALAYQYFGPSPGLTAGVSSLDRLPPATTLPDAVARNLDREAAYAGVSVAEAIDRMRLLRSGLSHGDLYAFRGTNGTVCFRLTGHVGSCLRDTNMGNPGVMWAVSGGYPREQSALVGIAADNVTALTLVVNGQRTNLAIVNNSFYAEFGDQSEINSMVLEAVYGDGSTKTIRIT
jgi:hypothetical protein